MRKKGIMVGYERISYRLVLLGGNMLMGSCCGVENM